MNGGAQRPGDLKPPARATITPAALAVLAAALIAAGAGGYLLTVLVLHLTGGHP